MINLSDKKTWPTPGSLWAHHNGLVYEVLFLTNVDSNPNYKVAVVYENTFNKNKFSRDLSD